MNRFTSRISRGLRKIKGMQIKTPEQIEKMRVAGRVVHQVLTECAAACKPGVSTYDVNQVAVRIAKEHNAECLFKNYPHPSKMNCPFPSETTLSVNEEIVHGIPGERLLQEGDIVGIDFACRIDGWCADAAFTAPVGKVTKDKQFLLDCTEHCRKIAVENLKPGKRWSEIARLMENYAMRNNLGVVKEYVGHGIGRNMHEAPSYQNWVSKALKINDIPIQTGMTMAIEPMCCLGTGKTHCLDDHWTVVTQDGKWAAHFEHTIAITENGATVLTDGS